MFTGWRTCLEPSLPLAVTKAAWWQPLPRLPTQLSCCYSPVTFFSSAMPLLITSARFSPPSLLCWVAGPSHPRCLPLPRGNPRSCPHFPGDGPSHSSGEPGEGGEEGWDGLLGMFLIPKAATSVRVGLPTQALFIQTGGPCSSSEAGSARCGGMDRGGGGAVTSWVAETP